MTENYIKIKNLCASKNKKVKRQVTGQENMLTIYIADNGFVSKIYFKSLANQFFKK